MAYLVGTAGGLFRVEPGSADVLADASIRHVVATDDGAVALADDGTLWSVDDDGAAEFDEIAPTRGALTCVLLDGDTLWLGTSGAHLLVVRDAELVPVAAFDEVPGRDAWYTPWGGPPEIRSIDVDDDGVLYVAVHVGGVVRSVDGGVTWEPTFDIHWDVHQVVSVPEYAQTVVAACGAGGLALSTDAGETWELDAEGLHATYARAAAISGDNVVLSVSDGPDGGRSGLYRRQLEDSVFERCASGLPEWFDGNVDSHCIAAWDEEVVVAAPGGELYVSDDEGRTWRRLASGLPDPRAIAII